MRKKYEKMRLFIERGTKEDNARNKYKYLSTRYPFRGKENIDIFVIAMVKGFKAKRRSELKGRDGFIRFNSIDQRSMTLIKGLAVSEEGSLTVLSDPEKVSQIAEEYANTGIRLLLDEFRGKDLVGDMEDAMIDTQKRRTPLKTDQESS